MSAAARLPLPARARPLRLPRPSALCALTLSLLFLGLLSPLGAQTSVSKEYQIKAAFLYNFTRYVDWPASRFENDSSPLVIAVLGKHPIEQELTSLAKERTAKGRAVQIVIVHSAEEIATAHMLFVPVGEEKRLPPSIPHLAGLLTVGESTEFSRRGGVITFTLVADKIRFEINQSAGERAGLRLSGQLLKLATVIRKDP